LPSHLSITYQQRTYDINTRRSDFAERIVNGFASLDDQAFTYLMDCKPEAVPSLITDLAPGDLREAFNQYFMAMRRGYLTGPVAS
jgi:hypothetical protein